MDLISTQCYSFLQGSQRISLQWLWCVCQTLKLMQKSIYPRLLGISLQLEQMSVAPVMKTSWHIKGNVRKKWRGVVLETFKLYLCSSIWAPNTLPLQVVWDLGKMLQIVRAGTMYYEDRHEW